MLSWCSFGFATAALITGLQRAALYDLELKYSALQRKAADWQSGLENSTSNKGCRYPRCLLSVQENNQFAAAKLNKPGKKVFVTMCNSAYVEKVLCSENPGETLSMMQKL